MASISSRTNKNGTESHTVWIRIKGAKPVSKTFSSLSRAQEFERKTEALIREELRKKSKPDQRSYYNESFKHVLQLYLDAQPPDSYKRHHLKPALDHFADCLVGDLRLSLVETYVKKILSSKTKKGGLYKPNSVPQHLSAMAAALKWRARHYDVHPDTRMFTRTLLPKNWVVRRDRRLEAHEERALLADMRAHGRRYYHWRLLVKLALETGARLQEMVLSTWGEFELDKRCWAIPAHHDKSRRGRKVPMSKAAVRILRALRLVSDGDDEGPFASLGRTNNVSSWFPHIAKRAGLEDFRLHDLRHEAVSRMVLNKRLLSVFEIMKIVGHAKIEMLQLYANLRNEELVDRFEDAEDPQAALMRELKEVVLSHSALLAAFDGRPPVAVSAAAAPSTAPLVSFRFPASAPQLAPALSGMGWRLAGPPQGARDGDAGNAGGAGNGRLLH